MTDETADVFITYPGEMMGGGVTFAELNRLLDTGYRVYSIQADGMIVLTSNPVSTRTRPFDDQETALRDAVQLAYRTLYEVAARFPNDAIVQNEVDVARAKLRAALFPTEADSE